MYSFSRYLQLLLLVFVIVLSGCSQQATVTHHKSTKQKSTDQAEQAPKVTTDIKSILSASPGKFSGDQYDKAKVEAELKKLPKNATAEEAYNQMVYLIGEDYKSVAQKIENFNAHYTITAKPGETKSGPEGKPQKKLNVEILLDSSGSMIEQVPGGVKMDLAKQAIQKFVSSLPKEAKVSLRVFGHKGSSDSKDKAISCQSTELVYPLKNYDSSSFNGALSRFKPTGYTPLAATIQAAQQDLQSETGENVENIIYIVSDGMETCGGNPVQAANELHHSNIKAVINIIGFDVDNEGQQALKQVAQSGGGEFSSVKTATDLQDKLNKEKMQLEDEWNKWWNDNFISTGKQEADLSNQVINLVGEPDGEMYKHQHKEYPRFTDAHSFLFENNILSSQEADRLDKMLTDRYQALDEYQGKWYEELTHRVAKEQEKARDQLSNSTPKN